MHAPCEGMRRRGCSLPRAGLAPAHGDGSRASQGPHPWCPRAPGGLSAAWPNRGGLGSPSGPWLPPVWEGGSAQGPAVWLACLCQPSERVPSATLTPGDGGHEAQSLPRAPWGSGPTTGQGCRVGVHSLWTGGGAPRHQGPALRLWAPLSPLRPVIATGAAPGATAVAARRQTPAVAGQLSNVARGSVAPGSHPVSVWPVDLSVPSLNLICKWDHQYARLGEPGRSECR